jgi:cobalt-zinc-cadmium efflux system membrane fusion protein
MYAKLSLVLCLLASSPVLAGPLACLIEPNRVADIGSQNIGVIERIFVERGNEVSAGQALALLKSDVERAALGVAQARAWSEGEINAAIAARDLARSKAVRTRELFAQNFVSQQAVDQADAEARVAEQRVTQARENQQIADREVRLSSSQLNQRKIVSPFSGVVVDRYRTEGERIEREPVVRIAQIDPLRVELILPASYFNRLAPGDAVLVKTDLPNMASLPARVALVDRVMDAASATFRVRLTLPNPERRIPAGLRCQVDLDGKSTQLGLAKP